jgi:hypothetical protein
MWSDNLLHNFWRVAFRAVCLSLVVRGHPFDRDSKQIASDTNEYGDAAGKSATILNHENQQEADFNAARIATY